MPSIGKHLPIFLGPGTVQWHNFSGKSDSVFRRYSVALAIPRGTMGGTLPDTNLVRLCEAWDSSLKYLTYGTRISYLRSHYIVKSLELFP